MGTTDRAPDALSTASVVVVGVGILSSVLSNVLFGRGIGDVSCMYTVKYSPSSPAFGIWFPIYVIGLLAVADQINANSSTNGTYDDTASNFLYGFAWMAAAVWTPAFTKTIKTDVDNKNTKENSTDSTTKTKLTSDGTNTKDMPYPPTLALAAVFLSLTATLSISATIVSNAWSKTLPNGMRPFSGMAYASLAGWTLVA